MRWSRGWANGLHNGFDNGLYESYFVEESFLVVCASCADRN